MNGLRLFLIAPVRSISCGMMRQVMDCKKYRDVSSLAEDDWIDFEADDFEAISA